MAYDVSSTSSRRARRANRGLPSPSSTGCTYRRYSSTRSASASTWTMLALPWTQMAPPGSCFNRRIPSSTPLATTCVLAQPGSSSVVENTTLGRSLRARTIRGSSLPSTGACPSSWSYGTAWGVVPPSSGCVPQQRQTARSEIDSDVETSSPPRRPRPAVADAAIAGRRSTGGGAGPACRGSALTPRSWRRHSRSTGPCRLVGPRAPGGRASVAVP